MFRVRRRSVGRCVGLLLGRPEFDTWLGTSQGGFSPTELTSDEETERNLGG